MDFGFTSEQEELRRIAREFFEKEAGVALVRSRYERPASTTPKEPSVAESGVAPEGEPSLPQSLWSSLTQLGWLSVAVPEHAGGSGLGALEAALLLEEAGRVVLPEPLLSVLGLAVPALVEGTSAEDRSGGLVSSVLRSVLSGRRVAVAVAEGRAGWRARGLRAGGVVRDADGLTVHSRKLFVSGATDAEFVLVACRADAGVFWFVVEPGTEGLSIEPMRTVDPSLDMARVRLDGVRVPRAAVLSGAPLPDATHDRFVDHASVLACAEMCGAVDRALELCLDYVDVREQFGRKLGSFQALQHKLADMKVDLENARSLTWYAAWALDHAPEEAPKAVAMAKAIGSETLPLTVAEAVQVHGGVGFTWEHDLHMYLKRVQARAAAFEDAAQARDRVANWIGLG